MKNPKHLFILIASILTNGSAWSADADFNVEVEVDLQQDVGQNFGTLFEVVDSAGNVIAGAGFVGAYNTQSRSDRRGLHFFVKPTGRAAFAPVPIARPSRDAGTYLFEFDNRLFSKGRGGEDSGLRAWDADTRRWLAVNETNAFNIRVGNGVLSSDSKSVLYDGQPILTLRSGQGSLAERYYANGELVFRRYDENADPPVNELVACRWTNTERKTVSLDAGRRIAMGTPREFVYAYGQLKDRVVAASNTGGLYTFDGQTWKTILEPDTTVSFQIYAMINYGDRLLMGQYPTGELFSYDGKRLKQMVDWPPTMPGVRKNAREAQTLTIYGGDLYAGVWPWGEVWRYGGPSTGWEFQMRMFTHPKPSTKTTHPYEEETRALGSVLNKWGQRVTSLVPLGDSLFISTSAKGCDIFEPKYTFLSGVKRKEYGTVYQHRHPGALAVPTTWVDEPTSFGFQVRGDTMTVTQDDKTLGVATAPSESVDRLATAKISWGQGVFGPFRGKMLKAERTAARR